MAWQSALAQIPQHPRFNVPWIAATAQADFEGIKKSLAQGAAPRASGHGENVGQAVVRRGLPKE
jgi:hypothetical protein